MWQLIPTILYLTYSEAHNPRVVYPQYNNDHPISLIQNDPAPAYYPASQLGGYNVPGRVVPNYPAPTPYGAIYPPYQRLPEDPHFDHNKRIPNPVGSYYFSPNGNHLRQTQSQSMSRVGLFGNEGYPFELDYSSSDSETDTEPKGVLDLESYSEDLELVENFGNYLKRRTQMNGSTLKTDAAHQYNALLAVLVALARVVMNSCDDFDKVYDQTYQQTVETYYKYGLNNAEKVAIMIDDYIRKGNSHMTKIKKLKQEACEKELFCAVTVDNKIKSSPLLYVKELETLEALTHLARSYYPYIEEFNKAVQKGEVLPYLQKSKDRLREYVMHIVNSVEHLTDKAVTCS